MNWILMQVSEIPKVASRLSDYGVMGIFASIAILALFGALLFIQKKYERHLKEKDIMIEKLEKKLENLEDRMRNLIDGFSKQMMGVIERNTDAIHNIDITINENSAVTNQAKGFMTTSGEKVIEILENVLEQQRKK